ncbi:MAG: hypothetical protein ABI608_02760 [Rhizomicrobium sp.]
MLKWIATGVFVAMAVAGAGSLFAAKAVPERVIALAPAVVPAGDKPFARICKSDELADARPSPAWVGASFSGDNCRAPRMPAAIDGFTASREQVVAGMEASRRYAAESDVFERCIADYVVTRKALAREKPLNNSVAIIENHRITASQRNRKLVSARVTAAINDFNEFGSGCPS